MNYWLMKTEPDVFSIADLKKKKRAGWDGVRNYQARNFMRDGMKLGDQVLFYHSSCGVPGVAGIARVSRESHPDPSQFDKKSEYYDPKATLEKPIWMMVEVEFVKEFAAVLPLERLRAEKALAKMVLLQKGSRLSVQPVAPAEWEKILELQG
ncbi:MAG: EVE domain-containing protein [Bdellovibrionota bacterium]